MKGFFAMDDAILNFFNSLGDIGVILKTFVELLMAVICGGLIGYEREKNGHDAGLRTHTLVSIGACLIMIISIRGPGMDAVNTNRDPARLAAQVVSGIGFLGAGTIIQNGMNIKGLTTAATIWLCGGLGLACGSGFFSGAILSTIISYITLSFLTKIEMKLARKSPKIVMLVDNQDNILKKIADVSKNYVLVIKNISTAIISNAANDKKYQISIRLTCNEQDELNSFVKALKETIRPEEISCIKK